MEEQLCWVLYTHHSCEPFFHQIYLSYKREMQNKKKKKKNKGNQIVGGWLVARPTNLGDCVSQAWFDEGETKTQNRGLWETKMIKSEFVQRLRRIGLRNQNGLKMDSWRGLCAHWGESVYGLTCCAEFPDCRFSLSLSLTDRRTRGRVGSSKEARLRLEFGVDEVGSDDEVDEGVICSVFGDFWV